MSRSGTTTYVTALPECDIHKYVLGTPGITAKYDKRTRTGQWGYVCEGCFLTETDGQLGTGYGQELILGERPTPDRQTEVAAALAAGDLAALEDAIGDGDPADFF
jgi:hypothetical protein